MSQPEHEAKAQAARHAHREHLLAHAQRLRQLIASVDEQIESLKASLDRQLLGFVQELEQAAARILSDVTRVR